MTGLEITDLDSLRAFIDRRNAECGTYVTEPIYVDVKAFVAIIANRDVLLHTDPLSLQPHSFRYAGVPILLKAPTR